MTKAQETVIQARQRAGLTQKQFGEKLKVGQSTVSQWENGERTPFNSTLEMIRIIFGEK